MIPNQPPPAVSSRSQLDVLFAPIWAGGWLYTRWLWAFAAFLEYGWRVIAIEDAYAASDMVFASGIYRLSEWFTMTPSMGYGLWAGTMLGIAMVAWGGRLMRPGLVVWAVCAWTLMGYEALNVKAHDRLITWVAVGLMLSPAAERDLFRKYRSPVGRWWMLITFCGIYGSTGLCKHLHETSWWTTGEVLGYHMLNHWHGGSLLGTFLSGQSWLLRPMAILTVLWEVGFLFAIWFRRLNPWVLLLGMMFHGMLLLTMQVGPFAFVSVAAYPILLDPETCRQWTRALLKNAKPAPTGR